MSIFATGKSGTIGQHFSKSVRPINFRERDTLYELSRSGFTAGDSLIHSAGIVGTSSVNENVEYSKFINVEKTVKLAVDLKKLDAHRMVFVSSSHVYGFSDEALDENSPLSPNSIYAEQKMDTEIALLDFASKSGFNISILRVFSILGWESKGFTLGGKLRSVFDAGSGAINYSQDVRDFLTPFQAARLIESLATKDVLPEIVNVASGVGLTIEQASKEMLESVGFDLANVKFQHSSTSKSAIVANTALLEKALGHTSWRFDAKTSSLN